MFVALHPLIHTLQYLMHRSFAIDKENWKLAYYL